MFKDAFAPLTIFVLQHSEFSAAVFPPAKPTSKSKETEFGGFTNEGVAVRIDGAEDGPSVLMGHGKNCEEML